MSALPNRVASTLELAAQVYEATSLIGVRLASLHADVHNRRLEPPYDTHISLTPSFATAPDNLTYSVQHEVSASSEDEETFAISCAFEVGFKHEGDQASQEAASAFGEIVVLTILQPYLRELVHRISSDLGYPELLLDNLDSKDLLVLLRESELKKSEGQESF
jgi:preprotein translocase subunit SecB